LTGSISFSKKIQNGVVLVKKTKVNELQPGFDRVLPGQPTGWAGSHRVMIFPIFSSIRPNSSPRSTRWAGLGGFSKL